MTFPLELIALLLILIAFFGGYVLARRGAERSRGAQVDKLRRSYFRGLNYLLNEQPDKAIEVFLQIAEVDKHTIETHLALGNLFRRRGETDRAIRVHQNLIARPNLTSEQKSLALLELGEDYMRAGLLDRAETLFTDLVSIDTHAATALRQLISVCQQERDWTRGIEFARRLEKTAGEPQSDLIAQFLCELSDGLVQAGKLDEARRLLAEARLVAPGAVRGYAQESKLAYARNDDPICIEFGARALELDAELTPELMPLLVEAYDRSGQPGRADAFLENAMLRYPGVSPVLAKSRRIAEREGDEAAIRFLSERLKSRPSVRGLAALVDLQIKTSDGPARDQLNSLRELLTRLIRAQSAYRCSKCGFGAKQQHWQCPGCKSWATVRPVHGVAGD